MISLAMVSRWFSCCCQGSSFLAAARRTHHTSSGTSEARIVRMAIVIGRVGHVGLVRRMGREREWPRNGTRDIAAVARVIVARFVAQMHKVFRVPSFEFRVVNRRDWIATRDHKEHKEKLTFPGFS